MELIHVCVQFLPLVLAVVNPPASANMQLEVDYGLIFLAQNKF